MDLRKLKKLIDLVEESGITELEVSEGEERVRIAKHPSVAPQQTYMIPQAAPIAATVQRPWGVSSPGISRVIDGCSYRQGSAPNLGSRMCSLLARTRRCCSGAR